MVLSKVSVIAAEALTIEEIGSLVLFSILSISFLIRQNYTDYINVPSIGVPSGILRRWRAGLRWEKESHKLIMEGMSQYGSTNKPFKIRHPLRWIVCMTDPVIINELKIVPQKAISSSIGLDHMIRSDYAFHAGILGETWHRELIRKKLTDGLADLLPEIAAEVGRAWRENTAIGDDWTAVNHFDVLLECASRATNRVLVGPLLSNNTEFLKINRDHAMKVIVTSTILDRTPSFLQPFVAWWYIDKEKAVSEALNHMAPVWEERIRSMKDGKWISEGKQPNDIFQWILEAAPPNTSIRKMTIRFLFLNFVAIHTTSFSITHALFDLASNPSLQDQLRDEVETQLREAKGWTQQALVGMRQADSVLRESGRMNGVSTCTMLREVVRPYTFSDGTHVTKGTWVVAPAVGIHRSDKCYSSPEMFDGLRFYNMRNEKGNANRLQNVGTSTEFLAFGHGERACPGRFFATNVLKVLMAYVLCNYEFKFEEGRKRPENYFRGIGVFPDVSVGLLFRKRAEGAQSEFFGGGKVM